MKTHNKNHLCKRKIIICCNKEAPTNKATPKDFIISIIATICAIFSLIVSFFSLMQMRNDHDSAYRPSILLNPIECSFSWNKDGEIDWINNFIKNPSETDFKKFNTVNIGVGAAKNIIFRWNPSNLETLNTYLINCDSTKQGFAEIREQVVFNYENKQIGTGKPSELTFMYLLPEASETYDLHLPIPYYIFIQEIIKSQKSFENIPDLELSIEYTDIQGKTYIDIISISVEPILMSFSDDNTGIASFRLIPQN